MPKSSNDQNPIGLKLKKMVEIGYLIKKKCPGCGEMVIIGPASYESLAFALGLKYATLMNTLNRPKVSYTSRMMMLSEGFIDHDDLRAYEQWLTERGISQDMRGRVRPAKKKIACDSPKHPKPDSGHRETQPDSE
jgi:hypothetical protein